MKDEILAGLRNALDRGSSVEEAVQSFINSGYNPQEVRAAAEVLSGGVSDIVYPDESKGKTSLENKENIPNSRNLSNSHLDAARYGVSDPNENKEEEKKSGKRTLIIGIIIASVIVLGAIGYLIYTLIS